MYVYSWFIVLTESLLTVRLAVSEIKPVQSLTDRRTDGQTELSTIIAVYIIIVMLKLLLGSDWQKFVHLLLHYVDKR